MKIKNFVNKYLFWIAFALLFIDLISYYKEINLYFTWLGIFILTISLGLLLIYGIFKKK